MLPVKGNVPQKANRLCPGARRSFFCRMKCKNSIIVKEESDSSSGCHRRKKSATCERKFCVIHCTGYLKSWAKIGMEDSEESEDPCNLSCLVAVGRILKSITEPPPNSQHRPITFISRHAIDGKFVFVDQRTTLVVGFLPQELLGTSMYEYFHHQDIPLLAEVHKAVLVSTETITTPLYRFRGRNGNCVRLQSSLTAFRNPWTRDIEYIIAKNTFAPIGLGASTVTVGNTNREEPFSSPSDYDFFAAGNGTSGNGLGNGEIQRLINSEVPFRKIGEQIADEVVESQSRNECSSSNSPVSVLEATALGTTSTSDLQLPSIMSPSGSTSILQSVPNSQSLQTQISSQSDSGNSQCQTSVPITVCLPNSDNITTGSSAAGQTEKPGGEILALTNRTNDPVMGSGTSANTTDEEMLYMISESVLPESPTATTIDGDGNDEAAMAVIMSLLEADAGLGGPVDFSGLPWPLP